MRGPDNKSEAIYIYDKPEAQSINKRVLPEPSGAGAPEDERRFYIDQFVEAESEKDYAHELNFGYSQLPSTAMFLPHENDAFAAFATGLIGCTIMIIYSTDGVYMAHFWESPSFRFQGVRQDRNFKTQVLDLIGPGDGSDGMQGLNQFLGSNGPFRPETGPRGLIVCSEPVLDALPEMINQIKSTVSDLFTRSGAVLNVEAIKTRTYWPKNPDQIKNDPELPPAAKVIRGSWGKVLYQYDPAQEYCRSRSLQVTGQWAINRIWVEDQTEYDESTWWAQNNQLVPYTPGQPLTMVPRGLAPSSQENFVQSSGLPEPHNLRQLSKRELLGTGAAPACLVAETSSDAFASQTGGSTLGTNPGAFFPTLSAPSSQSASSTGASPTILTKSGTKISQSAGTAPLENSTSATTSSPRITSNGAGRSIATSSGTSISILPSPGSPPNAALTPTATILVTSSTRSPTTTEAASVTPGFSCMGV